jgi:hypothetical protein
MGKNRDEQKSRDIEPTNHCSIRDTLKELSSQDILVKDS